MNLKIKGTVHELTVEELRALRAEIDEVLGSTEPILVPYPQPQYVPYVPPLQTEPWPQTPYPVPYVTWCSSRTCPTK